MIAEMRYITITGPLDHVDQVIEHYLSRYEIHLEYATQHLSDIPALRVLTGENPYQESAARGAFFLELLGDTPPIYFPMTGKQAQATIEMAHQQYEARRQHFKGLESECDIIASYIESLHPFSDLPLNTELRQLDNLKHFRCLFGRMPIKNFLQFETFLYEETPVLFQETYRDQDTVWGCFLSIADEDVDQLIAAYHFEPLPISATCLDEEIPGTPIEIIAYWEKRLTQVQTRIKKMAEEGLSQKHTLLSACRTARRLFQLFAIKQYAAKTNSHYIFVGWMSKSAAQQLDREVNHDEMTIFTHHEAPSKTKRQNLPPTKLINPPGMRWFEFFVKMYGTPRYTEIDPTPILAIAYALLFGMMFGDIGHGLSMALLGWLLLQRHQLGGIMIIAGLTSMFFGFLYGSIFGMEDWIPALWRHPVHDIAGTLWFAVALGAVVILLAMALNMANAFRQNDWDRFFFSPNGLAGMILYIVVIAAISGMVPWVIVAVPLAAIIFKGMTPQEADRSGIGMTIFQRALGAFEILLAYLTNTISFVRVGAFALSHAGMMHVVTMLSQESSISGNLAVFILGNLVVMGIEGLLIGIQSLRLGFYEIFSRFYEGGGRDFVPSNQV